MRKFLKPSLVFTIVVAFGLSAVLCCCTAASLMAHFHKTAMCSHCQDQDSHKNSSSPANACQQQLTSADVTQIQTISSPGLSGKLYPISVSLINHHVLLTRAILSAYPPGGPPLGMRFTPLYLRTFNLRI